MITRRAAGLVAGTEQDGRSLPGQLPCFLQADAFIAAGDEGNFSAGIRGPLSLHVVAIREQYQPDVLERLGGRDEVGFRNVCHEPIRPDIEICFQLLESSGARWGELNRNLRQTTDRGAVAMTTRT